MPGGSPAITAAVFRAVRTGNAFEETVERLLEGVKLGVYAPGDRLPPERELTRRLGISRITLREALRELAAAGYVETKRGRFGGTFILRQPEPMVYDELTRTATGLRERGLVIAALEHFVEARYAHQVWELEIPMRSHRIESTGEVEALVADFDDDEKEDDGAGPREDPEGGTQEGDVA